MGRIPVAIGADKTVTSRIGNLAVPQDTILIPSKWSLRKKRGNNEKCGLSIFEGTVKMHQFLTAFAAVSVFFFFFGCTTVPQNSRAPESDRSDQFALAKVLFKEGNYEAAMKENQKLLSEGKAPGDMALYNMGLIFACSLNPKRDYQKALDTFKKLVSQYPYSSFAEEVKVWIQVIEEHQKIADERQKFLEEKRNLTQEREILSQEREKLKYTVEKSRQLDIEIEKRRRESQSR